MAAGRNKVKCEIHTVHKNQEYLSYYDVLSVSILYNKKIYDDMISYSINYKKNETNSLVAVTHLTGLGWWSVA